MKYLYCRKTATQNPWIKLLIVEYPVIICSSVFYSYNRKETVQYKMRWHNNKYLVYYLKILFMRILGFTSKVTNSVDRVAVLYWYHHRSRKNVFADDMAYIIRINEKLTNDMTKFERFYQERRLTSNVTKNHCIVFLFMQPIGKDGKFQHNNRF